MEDVILTDAILQLKDDNRESKNILGEILMQQQEGNQHTDEIRKTIGELLTEYKNTRLDQAERDQEKKPDKPGIPRQEKSIPDENDIFDLAGVLAIVAGIGAAITGAVTGFVSGFVNTLKTALSKASTKIFNSFKNVLGGITKSVIDGVGKLGKPITDWIGRLNKAFSDIFSKRATGQILKSDTFKVLGKATVPIRNFIDSATKFFRQFSFLTESFDKAIRGARNLIAGVSFRAIDAIDTAGRNFSKFVSSISSTAARIVDSARDAIMTVKIGIQLAFESFRNVVVSGIKQVDRIIRTFTGFGPDDVRAIQKGVASLTKSTTAVTGIVDGMVDFIRSTVNTIKTFAGKLGGIFRMFSAIGRFIAFPITVVMSIWETFKGATEAMDKEVGAVDKTIAALFGGLGGLFKSLITIPIDFLKDGISWVLNKLGMEDASKFLDSFSLSDMVDNFVEGLISFWKNPIEKAKSFLSEMGDSISSSFNSAKDALFGSFNNVVENGKDFLFGIGDSISSSFESVVVKAKNLLSGFSLDSLLSKLSNMKDKVLNFYLGIGDKISTTFNSVIQDGKAFISVIADKIPAPFRSVIQDIKGFLSGIGDKISTEFNSVVTKGKSLLSGISFDNLTGALFDKVDVIVSNITTFFTGVGTIIQRAFTNIFQPIIDIFNGDVSPGEGILEFIRNTMNNIIAAPFDLVKKAMSWVLAQFGAEDLSEKLESFSFSEAFGRIFDYVTSLPGKLVNLLVDGLDAVGLGDSFRDMGDMIGNFIKKILRAILPKPDSGDSWYSPSNLVSTAIPESVYEYAGINKETGELLPPTAQSPELVARQQVIGDIENTRRENTDLEKQQTVANMIDASSRTVNNVSNSNTSAIIDTNQPTVDYNDRSWDF